MKVFFFFFEWLPRPFTAPLGSGWDKAQNTSQPIQRYRILPKVKQVGLSAIFMSWELLLSAWLYNCLWLALHNWSSEAPRAPIKPNLVNQPRGPSYSTPTQPHSYSDPKKNTVQALKCAVPLLGLPDWTKGLDNTSSSSCFLFIAFGVVFFFPLSLMEAKYGTPKLSAMERQVQLLARKY